MAKKLNFEVNNVCEGVYKLNDVFTGLETSIVLKSVFGDSLKHVLSSTRVEINHSNWMIWVNDGTISVNIDYLSKCDKATLYLDIVHELIHVKQFRSGLNLFDDRFGYVDSPTEIEAYKLTVNEARNIGLSCNKIKEYLRVDWITEDEHKRLIDSVMT